MDTLQQLNDTLVARKSEEASASYVASLYHGGVNKIAQKVGEEATEVVLAAKDAASDAAHKPALIAEVADLWFHSLVLLNHLDLSAQDVLNELQNRAGVSGHVEKANRAVD
jgi:phosphoribosyl-ATP pyrophosphohydrolase